MTTTPPDAAGLSPLPVPGLPDRPSGKPNEGPVTFTTGHHFTAAGGDDARELAEAATAPLSVIVQVTKRCDFGCVFCSETLMMPDPTLENLDVIRANLAGVQRVFLSGGEPLLRRDLPEIVTMYSEFILGLPTNATGGVAMASRLAGKVAFVNIGFDGPRAAFTQVRGDYDKVVAGVRAFLDAGLPVSLSAVVLRSTLHGLPYLYQIADVFDCGKLKLILPLRKGNALGLAEREFITVDEARDAFGRLTELRTVHDWRPAVRMTPWTADTEGHMIVVEPSAAARAPHPGITAAQTAWRRRRQHDPGGPRLLDTRYDTGHILRCASRRLVDVCADLNLDVTQPELRGTSMTALHRRWLEQAEAAAREKITVLNLRHALSTALVAARAAGLASWPPGLKVNTMLAAGLDGTLGWLNDPVFTALLKGEPGAA